MVGEPLGPSARRQLLWMAAGTAVLVLLAAWFLVPAGAPGWFVLACIALVGIVAIGQREEQLREVQGSAR